MLENPFSKSREIRFDAELEFRIFKEKSAREYRNIAQDVPNFEIWSRFHNFYLIPREPNAVQLSFGDRVMGRRDLNGKVAFETGLSLVYSLGPTGAIDIQMYPLSSELATVEETMIHLDLGYFTSHQLMSRLESDLSDLVTYGYVSSIDASASFKQSARIWFLRNIKSKQIDGKYEKAPFKAALFGGIAAIGSLFFRGFIASLFKPIAITIVISSAAYFGWNEIKYILAIK